MDKKIQNTVNKDPACLNKTQRSQANLLVSIKKLAEYKVHMPVDHFPIHYDTHVEFEIKNTTPFTLASLKRNI